MNAVEMNYAVVTSIAIVVGNRGLDTGDSLLPGSLADKVMHLFPVPVTVAP